jgi:hypothetical protein
MGGEDAAEGVGLETGTHSSKAKLGPLYEDCQVLPIKVYSDLLKLLVNLLDSPFC